MPNYRQRAKTAKRKTAEEFLQTLTGEQRRELFRLLNTQNAYDYVWDILDDEFGREESAERQGLKPANPGGFQA